jgi:hypothetical protein
VRYRLLAGTALALALAGTTGVSRASAQDAPAATDAAVTEETAAAALDAGTLLSDDDLDELVAPVALFPDSLLTQVLVASTYPLDLVKADRFIADNADLTDSARADAAEAEDWDPSVQVLAGGFPTVVQKMASDLDWTEGLGDAMLAQPDGVLDAVQRQRARAVAVGNLTSNDAQVVEQADDNISIAPAEPDVVYVPQYDATTAYTTPYTQPAVVDPGYSNWLTTGAIAFGSALLVDEIFDDDDDDWDDYWHHDNDDVHIDWDDGDIRPRPDREINVDGDVNIDRSRDRNTAIVDRDRTDIDRNRVDRDVDRDRIGDIGGDGAWRPSEDRRNEARDRIAARDDRGGAAADRLAERGDGGGGRAAAAAAAGAGGLTAASVQDKLKARSGDGPKPSRSQAGGPAKRPQKMPSVTDKSAFGGKHVDAGKTRKAADRGNLSVNKSKAAPSLKSAHKGISKPKVSKQPTRRSPPKSSAFKKPSGGGHHASAARSRGGHSRGGGGGRRR